MPCTLIVDGMRWWCDSNIRKWCQVCSRTYTGWETCLNSWRRKRWGQVLNVESSLNVSYVINSDGCLWEMSWCVMVAVKLQECVKNSKCWSELPGLLQEENQFSGSGLLHVSRVGVVVDVSMCTESRYKQVCALTRRVSGNLPSMIQQLKISIHHCCWLLYCPYIHSCRPSQQSGWIHLVYCL